MKRIFFLVVITLIGAQSLSAQADFRSGYVVLNSGDTLHGLIDFSGYKSRTQRCIFKQDNKAPKQEFYPDEAISYRYADGKYFISREVTINKETFRLFLEFIFDGIVDVFYFGGLAGHNYLIESDGNLYLLEADPSIVEINNHISFARVNDMYYVDVLKTLFAKSPTVVEKVDKVFLRHNDLIEISREYHNEIRADEPYIIYEKKLPMVMRYGLMTGLGFNRMMVFRDSPYYTFNSNFNNPAIPALGLFFSLNIPSINQHVQIVYEGFYFNRKLHALHNYPYSNQTVKADITLSQHVWQSSLMAKYRFPGIGMRPFLQLGIFYNNFFNNQYVSNTDVFSEWGNYLYSLESNNYPYNNYDTGLSLGGGLSKRKWFIDLRYNYGLGMHHNVFTQSLQLNLGYSLN